MTNMRAIMPALQRAAAAAIAPDGLQYTNVAMPKQQRATQIVKDKPADDIAREIVRMDCEGVTWRRFFFWPTPKPTER